MMNFFDKNPQYKNHPLFINANGHTVTYADWYRHADALSLLIPKRSLAVIICRNTIGSALSYLCCLQNRIVPLLIDHDMDVALMKKLIDTYRPAYIFQPASCAADHPVLYTLEDYVVWQRAEHSPEVFPSLALLLTTSGSTGSPKLVRQSYENIQSNAASIAQYLSLDAAQRPVSTLPMHYTFGLSVINSHVLVGAAEYLTEDSLFDASFWELCQTQHITSIAGVPFTYECLKRLRFTSMNLPSLTLMIQAGGKLSKRLQKEYADFAAASHKRFIVMYGQTEATARMSYLPAEDCLKKIGSIGIAIPGGTFHIMEDAHTEITTPNIPGELCYEGPNVTLGYAHCAEDLALGDERHGRLLTGDIAYVDEDGFYYITGRKKRFVKIMGKRVNMDEIEQLFKNTRTTDDFAATGHDDDLWVFTTAPAASISSLEDFLAKTTSLHPSCFTIRHIDKIPKNSSGKTQYTALLELTT